MRVLVIHGSNHKPETDRPMLSYLNGGKIAPIIDAGNSADMLMNFKDAGICKNT